MCVSIDSMDIVPIWCSNCEIWNNLDVPNSMEKYIGFFSILYFITISFAIILHPSDRFILFLFTGNFYRFCYCILRSIFGDATYTREHDSLFYQRDILGTLRNTWSVFEVSTLLHTYYTQCNNGSTVSMWYWIVARKN